MKKVLFASTALVAFASAASAEIKMVGWAEMGIVGGDNVETQFFNDVDIEFTLSGESDSGLTFGARVDLDEAGNLGREFDNQGTSVFISGSFGTLTLGDTDGAVDWAITDAGNVGNPGSIQDQETTHAGYLGAYGDGFAGATNFYDNQILRYDYSFGNLGFAVSYEQAANPTDGILVATDPNGAWALGVKYALDLGGTTVNLGAGYRVADFGTADDMTIWAVSADAKFGGGFAAGIAYSDWQDVAGVAGADDTHIGVGLGYASGPIALHVNYGEYDSGPKGWGLAAAYDLGGGLKVLAGYNNSDVGATSTDTWSLGVKMAF